MTQGSRGRIVAAFVIPLAMLVTLLTWGLSSPPGSSPDDDYHMASIWCAAGTAEDLCEEGGTDQERVLPADLLSAAGCFAFNAEQAASCPRDEAGMAPTSRGNWSDGGYPPVFYAVMHLFAGEDLSTSIVAMRSVNALVYVGLLTALFFLLPIRLRPPLIWGAAITAIPLGLFLIPSVNPSSWAVISASGLWLAMWGFFEQHGARKWLLAVLTIALLIIGAGARSDSAVYGALALIAGSVLAFRRERPYLFGALLPAALILVAVAFFFSGGQSAIVTGDTVVENETYSFPILAFVDTKALPQLLVGVFGVWGLGWLDTYMPGLVWVPALAVFSGVVFWGLSRGEWRKWLALAGIGASIIAVPMYILLHDGVVVGNGVQPRYIYPLMIIFAGLAAVGFSRAGLGLGRVQLLTVATGLIIANSVALHVNIRRYVTGVDLPGINLDRDVEWWWNAPISPMGTWAIGSLAFAVVIGALVRVVWGSHAAGRTDRS